MTSLARACTILSGTEEECKKHTYNFKYDFDYLKELANKVLAAVNKAKGKDLTLYMVNLGLTYIWIKITRTSHDTEDWPVGVSFEDIVKIVPIENDELDLTKGHLTSQQEEDFCKLIMTCIWGQVKLFRL